MSEKSKLLLLLIADSITICTAQIVTLFLLDQWYQNPLTLILSVLAFVATSWINGFYKTNIPHVGIGAVKQALTAVVISALTIFFLAEPIRLTLFASVLMLISVIGYRVIARELLFLQRHRSAARTLVYGAGAAGVQFVTASMQGNALNVVGYVDDDPKLCGTSIHGRTVFASRNVEALIKKNRVQIIVLALPSLSKPERKRIIESLIPLPVRVITVPTYQDLIEGKQRITQTEDISIEDLLGRDPVPPLDEYVRARTTDKVSLVTGAGGSIGSELCRQIIKCNPKHLILLDSSEPSLFAIEQELLGNNFTQLTCCLGSVTDQNFIAKVFGDHNIDCVYTPPPTSTYPW